MATCDPQTLVNGATCIEQFVPSGMQLPVLIWLMCQVVANGGGGGGGGGGNGQMVLYTVFPPANPPNTALPAIAYDPTGALGNLNWNPATLSWT
jgi:hypothetical protein